MPKLLGFVFLTRTEGETLDSWALRHPSGVSVSIMTHRGTKHEAFDERRVGLDHFAMQVDNREELEHWVTHLDLCGVAHSGIIDATWGPTVVFRDPDNIQLELFVHPAPREVVDRLGQQTARTVRA